MFIEARNDAMSQ